MEQTRRQHQQECEMKWRGQQAASKESLRISRRPSFQRLTKNRQDKDWSIYIDWSVRIRCLWHWTSEEANTETSRWQWRTMSKGHRHDSGFLCRTTQVTTHRAWALPNNKRSEIKNSDKTKRCFENTPPWTDPWKTRLSRQCNQYYYPHWWISSQG